jgi:hypothetical protein
VLKNQFKVFGGLDGVGVGVGPEQISFSVTVNPSHDSCIVGQAQSIFLPVNGA